MKNVEIKIDPVQNIDDIKATMSITWTIGEWKSFIKQCTFDNKTWSQPAIGNIYILEFRDAIKKILTEAEDRYQYKHKDKEIEEAIAVMDSVN